MLCRSSSNTAELVHGHQCIALPLIRERATELSQCPRSRESLTFLFQFHPSTGSKQVSKQRQKSEQLTQPSCMLAALRLLLCLSYLLLVVALPVVTVYKAVDAEIVFAFLL